MATAHFACRRHVRGSKRVRTNSLAMDDELSAHRTRTNIRPTQQQPPPELIAAINAVFEQPIEDKQ